MHTALKTIYDPERMIYSPDELSLLLIEALILAKEKGFSGVDLDKAYITICEMPDANIGTVLRLVRDENNNLSQDERYKDHYSYQSKYIGRNTCIHREIVETERSWFLRIR